MPRTKEFIYVKPHPRAKIFIGAIVFLVGLLLYYDLPLPLVLMIVGLLIFLKGIYLSYK